MPPLLIFIRHGQTTWNAEGRLQGQRDIPLNETGRAQAKRNGAVLERYLHSLGRTKDSFEWTASPLGRARETMEILRREMSMEISSYGLDDRLREITFGEWEGFTMKELKAENRPAVMARKADKWGFVPPGGESYADLSKRIGTWLESLDRDTVVVAHGGISRVLRGLLFRSPTHQVPVLNVPQDRFLVVRGAMGAWL